ncbi:MAG: hypothetical protein EPN97_02200 [Alphaproteobacteria bacterium]|nr:MAG: hypothetical protein EPN97_02200 [Alphaproteobacteria bacterium]
MNILRFLPHLALAALVVSAPAPALAQNDPMGTGSFSGVDIETAVSDVMMETSQDSEQDIKDQMDQLKKQNEKKKAERDAQQKMKIQKSKLRDAAAQRYAKPVSADPPGKIIPPPKTVPAGLQAKKRSIGDLKDEKDSIAEMNEQDQLNLQGYQERQTKTQKTISDVAKKSSDTQNAISGNLK